MNIMHVVFSYNNGGIENLLVDIVNNWNFRDDNLYLCIINDNYDSALLDKFTSNKFEVIFLNRCVGGGKIPYIKTFNNIIRAKEIDIIHCHSNTAVKFCVYSKICNKDLKLVYTVHDTLTYDKFSKFDIFIHRLFVDKIVAISNCVYRTIIRRYNKSNDICMVYNAVDNNKFSYSKNKSPKIRIGCIARLVPDIKGQDVLIRAVAILKNMRSDFECLIVGAPPTEQNEYLEGMQSLVEALEVTSLVEFTGNCSNVPELLSTFDVLVLPSRKEGFGISIIEAFFSHVPVIASDIEGPREIIKDNQYGRLFEVDDYKKLAELINQVIEDNSEDLTDNAYKYAVDNFSIEIMVLKLRSIYGEL